MRPVTGLLSQWTQYDRATGRRQKRLGLRDTSRRPLAGVGLGWLTADQTCDCEPKMLKPNFITRSTHHRSCSGGAP